jgi:agmatinase
VTQVWKEEIAHRGVEAISRDLVLRLARRNVQEVYVSFDIDVLDESYAGATGTPEPDGLTPTEAIAIARAISARFPVAAADVMEVAPQVRAAHIRQSEPKTTLAAAAEVSTFLMNAIARHYEGAG